MHKSKKYPVAGIVFLCISCTQYFFPYLQVISIQTEDHITIVFSAEPEPVTIKDAFSLTEDDTSMDGSFVFDGDTVSFYPDTGIQKNHDYEVSIGTDAEDMRGCSLEKEYTYSFSTKAETIPPEITEITPANESDITSDPGSIEICFSEAIDTVSFTDAFSLDPGFDYYCNWNETCSAVTIIPAHPLEKGTRYFIEISDRLKDTSNNYLQEDFESWFRYGTDVTPPSYTVSWKNDSLQSEIFIPGDTVSLIPMDAELILSFDEQIPTNTISGYLSIKPSLSYTVFYDNDPDDTVSIQFSVTPDYDTVYVFTIDSGIGDESGNDIDEAQEYRLCFNNESYRPVEFVKGYLENGTDAVTGDPAYEILTKENSFSNILLSAIDFPDATAVATDLFLIFSVSSAAEELDRFSAMEHISLSATNSCAEIAIYTMEVVTDDNFSSLDIYTLLSSDPDYAEGTFCAVKIGLEITNSVDTGLLELSIDEELSDIYQNTLPSDILLVYNKE